MGVEEGKTELVEDRATPEAFSVNSGTPSLVESTGKQTEKPESTSSLSSCSVSSIPSDISESSESDMPPLRPLKRNMSKGDSSREDESNADIERDESDRSPVDRLLPKRLVTPSPPPTFEDIQDIIGNAGVWQLKVFLLASFSGFCTAMHNLVYGFIGAVPDHWCKMPNISGYTDHELKELLIPKVEGKLSQCSTYGWNHTLDMLQVDTNSTLACQGMEYDHSEMRTTVPMEWDLVCEDAPWASAIQITYMTGILVGSPIIGAISDRFGRKVAILIATLIFVVIGPLIAFSPNFHVLIVLRFILAFGCPGIYQASYVLAIEVTSEKWRGTAGNYYNLPWAMGYMILPGVAYLIKDWKSLQVVLSLPSLILLVTFIMIPESPRWLIRKGKLADAEKVLRRAAKMNKRERHLPDDFADMIKKIYQNDQNRAKKLTSKGRFSEACRMYLSIVRSPRMRLRFLTLCVCWAIIGMTYYGLAFNSPNLSTSRYWYTFIGGVLEVPAYVMVPQLIERFGRKHVFIVLVGSCGLSLLSSLCFSGGSLAIIGLSYLGKFVIGGAYSLIYLYSSEMVPTLVRTYALGVCSMMARLGSTVAPVIVDVVGRDHHMYPSLIFGSLAVLAASLSIMLPETKGKPLPETIEDVEKDEEMKNDSERRLCFRCA